MRNEKTEMAVENILHDRMIWSLWKKSGISVGVEDVTLIQYNGEYHG